MSPNIKKGKIAIFGQYGYRKNISFSKTHWENNVVTLIQAYMIKIHD